jgi:large conductance mechanosensitive channel
MLDEAAGQPQSSETLCTREHGAQRIPQIGEQDMRGFKNFLMRGDVIVVAVGLVIALAFSALINSFTTYIVNPLIQSFTGSKVGLSVQIRSGNPKTILDFGSLISAIINFVIFVAVVYFLIVVPYKMIQARRGQVVFGDPAPVKTCPYCLSSDLPAAASKCKYCGTDQPAQTVV